MALTDKALTSVANLQAYLQRDVTSTTDGRYATARLEPLIERVSGAIEGYCDRQLKCPAADQTITIDHNGGPSVHLYALGLYPIVSITSITNLETSAAITARSTIFGAGYLLGEDRKLLGKIDFVDCDLPTSSQSLTIVGKWGYDATVAGGVTREARVHKRALDTLEQACLMWAYAIFANPNPGAEQITIESLSMTVTPRRIPDPVAALLAPYRLVMM